MKAPKMRLPQTTVNQIYAIVNQVFQQMTGMSDIQTVDTSSLVAMGEELNNLGKADLWLNTLARRIGYTIDGYRVYKNKYSDLMRTQLEWGAIVQKLTVGMPEAVEDVAYNVGQMDGQSVDHYIISNPVLTVRYFDKETPYSFFITMQDWFLREAFLSESAMYGLINQIWGKVQNKIEFVLEELARITVANFILNTREPQRFHLVSRYNATGPLQTVTTQSALYDPNFLRWTIGQMNNIARKMQSMSVLFNSEGFQRFTDKSYQRFYLLSDFQTQMETVVQYEAFNPQYVEKAPDISIPYWQGVKDGDKVHDFDTVSKIMGTVDGKPATLNNVIGIIFDRDAMGTFREEERVYTTPINARGAYYNTFWHERQLWFNDMSENGVVFLLD